jgi:hypothetical protein
MVLEWIDPIESSTKIRMCENTATKQSETSLHMHTQTTWPHTLLVQAKWLSAFCTFSGLTVYPGKIKATIVDPKHKLKMKPDGTKYCPSALTVFDHQ